MTSTLGLMGLAGLLSLVLWRLGSAPDGTVVQTVHAASDSLAHTQEGDVDGLESVDAAVGSMAAAPLGGRSALIGAKSQPITQRATVEINVQGLLGPAAGAVVVPHQKFYARRPSSPPAGQGVPQPEADPTEFTTDENGQLIIEVAASTQSTLLFTWPTSNWVQQITWTSPRQGVNDVLKVRFPLAELDMKLQARSFPSGAAIEGALVSVGSVGIYTIPKDDKKVGSDRHGILRVPATQGPTRDPYIITVMAEGHSWGRVKSTDLDPTRQTPLWLPKYAQLRGVVAQSERMEGGPNSRSLEVFLVPRGAVRDVAFDHAQIRKRAPVDLDGSWTMPSVNFESRDETLNDYVLLVGSTLQTRPLAEDLFVRPGDEFVIEDPLLQGPRLDLKFLLADGRPALAAGSVLLSREPTSKPGAAPRAQELFGLVGPKGILSFPGLPPGTWQWRIFHPGATGEPTGTFVHDSAEPTKLTVKLEGHTDIEGRVLEPQLGSTLVYWHAVGTPKSAFGKGIVNADGEFKIPLVPVLSTVKLMATIGHPSFMHTTKELQPRWPDDVVTLNVGDKGLRNVVLNLPDLNQPKDDAAIRFRFNDESSQR